MKASRVLVFLGLLAIAGHACADVVSEPAEGSTTATPLRKLNSYYGKGISTASAQSSAAALGGGSSFAFSQSAAVAANGASFASSSSSAGSFGVGGVSQASSSANAFSSGPSHPVYQHPRNKYLYRCYWTKNGCHQHHGKYGGGYGGRKMLGGAYFGGGYGKASAFASAGSYYQPHYGKGKGYHQPKVVYYQPRRWHKPHVQYYKYVPYLSWNKGH